MVRQRMGIVLLALGLSGACGGGDGDGDGNSPVTPAQATALCEQSCESDATCHPEDIDSNCQSECETQGLENYSFSAVSQFLDCATASCEASEDACLLDVPLRDVDRQYEAACDAYGIMCEMEDLSFCDLSEPEGGAFLRLFTSDAVAAAAACFDATCEEISTVNSCLGAIFGFDDEE